MKCNPIIRATKGFECQREIHMSYDFMTVCDEMYVSNNYFGSSQEFQYKASFRMESPLKLRCVNEWTENMEVFKEQYDQVIIETRNYSD